MEIAALFPGQGSQLVGMGRDFFTQSEVAREAFTQADTALGFSLSTLCFDGPIENLTLTENAQPAILVVSIIAFRLLGITPDCAAGHSLGEYSALVASGSLRFQEAVCLVHKRGRYMQEAVKPGEGKMVAVLGPEEAEIQAVIDTISGVCEIANINSPGQIVVAGTATAIDAFSKAMGGKGGKILPLNVSAPFHCRLMAGAAERLSRDLDQTTFSDPKFPIYSNVTAQAVVDGRTARELLKQQVCASVLWSQSMVNMIAAHQITHAIEFGAGSVLTKLLKRISSAPARIEISDMASLEKTQAILGAGR